MLWRFEPNDAHFVAINAAQGGYLDVLRWAREQGCTWSATACAAAAEGGHEDVLRRLRQLGCPWGVGTCSAAARGGHLDMLMWAREQGCPLEGVHVNVCSDAGGCERERAHLLQGRWGRASRGVEVGAGTPLPVERGRDVEGC